MKPLDALTPDSTKQQCKQWLKALSDSPYAYHLDDDPAGIYNIRTGVQTFTPDQAATLTANLDICQKVMTWNQVWKYYFKMFSKHS